MGLLLYAIYFLKGVFKWKYILIIRCYIHHAPRSPSENTIRPDAARPDGNESVDVTVHKLDGTRRR